MRHLDGQRALLTGASGGLGGAIAQALAGAGPGQTGGAGGGSRSIQPPIPVGQQVAGQLWAAQGEQRVDERGARCAAATAGTPC